MYKAVVEVRASEDILMEAKSRDTNGALYCVPVIVKDNIDVQGMVSAAGSIAMESMRQPAQAHAPAVARLVEAGAVVLGHANMDEFALGFRTSSSRGGQTLNAFDKSRYPGGSSGGTAVAVALGLAVIGVGTDTGGSVRIPSSFAGLFGIRPTTGGVPVEGVVPLSHSRDTVGFMAANAQDVATSWAIASGQPWCVETAARNAPRRIGVLPMLLPTESGLGRAFADATTSRAAQKGSGSVFVALAEDAALEEVSRLVAQLSKQKSTSYFEFQDDLRKATGLELASIAAVTAGPCEERLPSSECASVVSTMQKKVHGKLRKREVEMYDLLTRTFPALFEAALTALMRAQRLDAFAYPTFKKLPSRISSGKQQYCANNRLAPSVGWPALTLPLATYERLPQGVEVMVPKGRECLLFEIAASLSA
ncbi:Glutamyl-tRNAGln amidotransferase subunit A, mitochondrial [Hondaea fermentalgiana]|uniref:Glutamyl-tRNAGln amidotransferase subunit A, mitochondrial n=1 Tax=Hondaea fermentalgiana TaxID=2315210 RepID=A0A2R5GEY7_9STRA|nr:Glutamyl-tRNAGln amidotransferase subunit A, mitochondrial [Hondaea fermentalgiana]|eukprot:GBG29155.1 Glutamyl-tRNAGln amidotransferase subunit A, mitochondrial [Hondaea fermentalgiana]